MSDLQQIPAQEVHDLVRNTIAKCPFGEDMLGAVMTAQVMLAFKREKIICMRDESLTDIPARRRADVALNDYSI